MRKNMMRIFIVSLIFSASIASAGPESNVVIDQILAKNNYAIENWEPRGLNPSPPAKIALMNAATKTFLTSLKSTASNSTFSKPQLEKTVRALVDDLPWYELDTEEREFLADVISPAITSVGLNPKVFF